METWSMLYILTLKKNRSPSKLKGYGIKNEVLLWVHPFLMDCNQVVTVNRQRSSKRRVLVLNDVLQGSILGPLLFVLFINDLSEVVRSILYLYLSADDTKLLKKNKKKGRFDSIELQSEVEALDRWTTILILQFHPGKCHVLTLGKFDNIKHAYSYKLGNNKVTTRPCLQWERSWGNLRKWSIIWKTHIQPSKKSKFNNWFNQKKLFHLNPDLLRQLYITFVRPSRLASRRFNIGVLLAMWWKCTNIFTSTIQQQYRVSSLLGTVQVKTTNLNWNERLLKMD